MMPPPRRKKWTEVEERTLIDKYGEMVCDGTLAKMKTREKKYKPIALYVNTMHHACDPIMYPWQWTWKDVSTKVQNMRHQYALVKQKIRKPEPVGDSDGEEFDWMEGLAHWSNFLRYKEVFGDVALVFNGNDLAIVVAGNDENGMGFDGSGHGMENVQFGHPGHVGEGDFATGIDGVDNGIVGLDFDYDGEEGGDNYSDGNKNGNLMKEGGDDGFVYEDIEPTGSDMRKKRKVLKGLEKRAWGFLANQLGQLREIETRFEQREAKREREREMREQLRMEMEQDHERKWEEGQKEREESLKAREKLRRQRIQELDAMEKEIGDRERSRREESSMYEREWEERIYLRRSEWKKGIEEMLSQHRAEMSQMQTRILHEQQNLTSHLLGIVSQWAGHPTGLSDHTGAGSYYLPQMMQNLPHVNSIVHGDSRVEGDNQEDQFIVDG